MPITTRYLILYVHLFMQHLISLIFSFTSLLDYDAVAVCIFITYKMKLAILVIRFDVNFPISEMHLD